MRMKRYISIVVCMALLVLCTKEKQAAAYTVTLEEDSIYAEVIPAHIRKNVEGIFRKQVQKAMKYHNKYKSADAYTYMKEVPEEYRSFIKKVKLIKPSDKIVISYPFHIYTPALSDNSYEYYFVVKRNQEKLCIFMIDVDGESGETRFYYDEGMDSYLKLDENITEETLFYQVERVIYAQTPEKVTVARDMTNHGAQELAGEYSDTKGKLFAQKEYEEKKTEILEYLGSATNKKAMKKSNESVRLELKDEYVEPEEAEKEDKGSIGIYITVLLCAVAAFSVIFVRKRRRTGQEN